MRVNLDLLDNLKGKFDGGQGAEERKREGEMGKKERRGERGSERRRVMERERKGEEGEKESMRQGGRESTALPEWCS